MFCKLVFNLVSVALLPGVMARPSEAHVCTAGSTKAECAAQDSVLFQKNVATSISRQLGKEMEPEKQDTDPTLFQKNAEQKTSEKLDWERALAKVPKDLKPMTEEEFSLLVKASSNVSWDVPYDASQPGGALPPGLPGVIAPALTHYGCSPVYDVIKAGGYDGLSLVDCYVRQCMIGYNDDVVANCQGGGEYFFSNGGSHGYSDPGKNGGNNGGNRCDCCMPPGWLHKTPTWGSNVYRCTRSSVYE